MESVPIRLRLTTVGLAGQNSNPRPTAPETGNEPADLDLANLIGRNDTQIGRKEGKSPRVGAEKAPTRHSGPARTRTYDRRIMSLKTSLPLTRENRRKPNNDRGFRSCPFRSFRVVFRPQTDKIRTKRIRRPGNRSILSQR